MIRHVILMVTIRTMTITTVTTMTKLMILMTNWPKTTTTIRDSSYDSYMIKTTTTIILRVITMALMSIHRTRMMVMYLITLIVMII